MSKSFFTGLYAFAALLVLSAFAFKVFQPIQVLPRMRISPAYNFIDQSGQPLTSETLRGHFVLYSFTYTQAPRLATTSPTPCRKFNPASAKWIWAAFPSRS